MAFFHTGVNLQHQCSGATVMVMVMVMVQATVELNKAIKEAEIASYWASCSHISPPCFLLHIHTNTNCTQRQLQIVCRHKYKVHAGPCGDKYKLYVETNTKCMRRQIQIECKGKCKVYANTTTKCMQRQIQSARKDK